MICDVHAHYIPKAFSDFMGDRFSPRIGVRTHRHREASGIEFGRGHPRAAGADGGGRRRTQVLSPHRPPYLPDETECVQALHLLNDGYAELARRYPGRIASYVMLPLPHIDASLREMERGLDQLGCVGVNMNISCLGRSIAEADFEPVYAEMNRRGAILFVHPSVTGVCSPVINDWGFRAAIGNSVEDAMFVAHVIARQIPHRYPEHPLHRAASRRADPDAARPAGPAGRARPRRTGGAPSVTARRFWYDTVCYGSKAAFTCACEAFGVEKLVTGSDYPVLQDYEEYRETFAYIERMGLPQADTDRILHHNAQALFGFTH